MQGKTNWAVLVPPAPHKVIHSDNGRVNLFADQRDWTAYIMGQIGYANKAIRRVTGLTDGQINYRLKLAGVSRRAFRNGETPEARQLLSWVGKRVAQTLLERRP